MRLNDLKNQLAPVTSEVGHPRDGHVTSFSMRGPALAGGLIILVTFVFFGGWAALAPLSSAAMAPGAVTAESGRQVIQHLEEAIVTAILVQDGDKVKTGDVLIRLGSARAQAELGTVRNQLDLADATQSRLIAERDGLAKPVFDPALLDRSKEPGVADILSSQMAQFSARQSVIIGQKNILHQKIEQYQEQVQGYRAVQTARDAQLKLVKVELTDLSGLLQEGFVTKTRVLSLQREQAQLEGEIGQAIAQIAQAEQGIGEARLQIFQIDKQRQEDISKELHTTDAQLAELRVRLTAATDVVKRLDVVSPIDGTVFNLAVHTLGGVVTPGAPIMEIVSDHDPLVIEAEINPTDLDSVQVGQEVSLRISTSDARLTPVIFGRLDNISADRVTPPNSNRSFYRARISVPPEQAARLGQLKLRIGMPVEAQISRGSHSALHYAIKPLLDSLARSFHEQ